MNKFSFTAIIIALSVSSPVFAQESEDFSGAKGTVVVGIDRVSTPFDFEIQHPNGVVFGAALGYDLQSGNFVYGVEAELTEATGNQEVGSGEIGTGRDIYGGIRLGIAVSDKALLYIKGGYTNFRLTAGPSGADNFHGARIGTGLELNVSENIYLRGEYRYSNYEVFLSRHQGMIGMGLNF